MKPCKYLDYDEKNYTTAKLVTIDEFSSKVKYWERKDPSGNIQKVQFCKLRGRIKGIFQCYNEGEMNCYEPVEDNA